MIDMMLVLAVLGGMAALYLTLNVLNFVFTYALANFSYAKFKGDWAVVTGASAGIGAGMARQLAKRGVNVVLLARNQEALTKVAAECRAHGVQTQVVTFDFAAACASDWSGLADRLAPLSPAILVNNVGVNVSFPTEYVDMGDADVTRIVNVNIGATNHMTAMLLPGMLDKQRGIILNMASGGGVVTPAPLLAPYAGTKAYNDAFAVSLHGEVSAKNVHVHSLTPFFVESAMAKMRASLTVPTADRFAECALRLVGSSPRVNPYWMHAVMGGAVTMLPLRQQVAYVTSLHRDIRARALRKKERLAKKS